MDTKKVLALAHRTGVLGGYEGSTQDLELFVAAITAAVKEEDATICEELMQSMDGCAAAIRASIEKAK